MGKRPICGIVDLARRAGKRGFQRLPAPENGIKQVKCGAAGGKSLNISHPPP
jgi:hypothetical protein